MQKTRITSSTNSNSPDQKGNKRRCFAWARGGRNKPCSILNENSKSENGVWNRDRGHGRSWPQGLSFWFWFQITWMNLSIPLSYFKISEEFQVDTGVRDGDPGRQEQRRQTKTQPSSSTFHWAREQKKTSIKLNLEYCVYDQLQPRITKPVLHD